MNSTTIFNQQQRLKTPNGVRTPHLKNFPIKYHDLFLKIGKAPFVREFSAKSHTNGCQLKIWLREGEICNLVVNQRLKRLFNGIPNVQFPKHFEDMPIIISLPTKTQ